MLKIGHRGAKAYAAENTISSFKKALELGVDMVELDVRITKDKHPIILHDSQLMRLTKKFGLVKNLNLKEVKNLKIKHNETIPTLGEVLEVIGNKVGLDIELKVKGSALVVIQTLRDYKIDFSSVMICSNYPGELREAEQLEPEITTALLFRSVNSFSFWFFLDFLALLFLPLTKYYIYWIVKSAKVDYLSINHRLLNEKNVRLFKKKKIKICAWTVDSQEKIDYLKGLGVDGIITNYPDRL